MNIDKAIVIPLFGTIPCHECGIPGQWFVNGATLPCRCSVRSNDQLADMLALIARYKDVASAVARRAQMTRKAEGERLAAARAADRELHEADLNALINDITKVVLPA